MDREPQNQAYPEQSFFAETIVGPVPPEMQDTLASIYHKIDAQVVRDDLRDGQTEGIILHEGTLEGHTYYVLEEHGRTKDGQPTLDVRPVNADAAQILLDPDTSISDGLGTINKPAETVARQPKRSTAAKVLSLVFGGGARHHR